MANDPVFLCVVIVMSKITFNEKNMNILKSPVALAVLTGITSSPVIADANTTDIERVIVTSDFRQQNITQLPTSVAIVDEQDIQDQSIQHFQEVLNKIANINFAGGSSRPKYIQIRGVGERSEYRGAPNSSVGFIIDDIDLSGLGMAASMYDVQQVEVLRGPQGTRFGANALAGMIYVQSNQPTDEPEHGLSLSLGDDDLVNLAGYTSGKASDKLGYRVSVESHQQNGYRDNTYLNIEDSNAIDELTGRVKLQYQATEHLRADFTLLFADMDNGYDAWTLDNNGFKTLTDHPGEDSQNSFGSALKLSYDGANFADITAITSFTDTDHTHAYDGDWANPEYWGSKSCTDYYDENGNGQTDDVIPCVYEYLWAKKADRQVLSQELRFASKEQQKIFNGTTDWLVGVYLSELEENNDLDSSYNGWPDEILDSQYEARNVAVFGQLDSQINEKVQLSTGLRLERRSVDYVDSNGDAFSPSETMWGGHVSVGYQLTSNHDSYIRIAKGYKAGGFNMGLPAELSQFKEFDTESLYNYEIGVKSSFADNTVVTRLAAFYMDRRDQQVNASQQDPDNPQRFTIYTANAASSSSSGIEFEADWQATANLVLSAALGYLDASYDDYAYFDKYGSEIDISGRQLAHAPDFTYSFSGVYRADSGIFVSASVSGKSDFYFSDSHSEKADDSHQVDMRVGYEAENWAVYLWARNLTDEKIASRGFYFGNEPDLDWASKEYVRYNAPRHIGVTLDWSF